MKDTRPAFPCVDTLGDGPTGMTLRDYFAARVISTALSHRPMNAWEWLRWFFGRPYRGCASGSEQLAQNAYAIADAMLRERDK